LSSSTLANDCDGATSAAVLSNSFVGAVISMSDCGAADADTLRSNVIAYAGIPGPRVCLL
jgi:hypothetical protein